MIAQRGVHCQRCQNSLMWLGDPEYVVISSTPTSGSTPSAAATLSEMFVGGHSESYARTGSTRNITAR